MGGEKVWRRDSGVSQILTFSFSTMQNMLGAKYFNDGKNNRFYGVDSLAESSSIRVRDLFTDIAISERGTLWNH